MDDVVRVQFLDGRQLAVPAHSILFVEYFPMGTKYELVSAFVFVLANGAKHEAVQGTYQQTQDLLRQLGMTPEE